MSSLGIDPGSLTTGWGLIEGGPGRPRLVECGVIRAGSSEQALALRLLRLKQEMETLVRRLQPTSAAVESPFQGVNARSALHLAHARGVILAVLAEAAVEIVEYTPATVKKSVTGNGRAPKEQVRAMVGRLLSGDPGRRSHDLYDALAVALCHMQSSSYHDALARRGV